MPGKMSRLWLYMLPYCLQRPWGQNDGTWVLLNRVYKPVGFVLPHDRWVDSTKFPVTVRFKAPLKEVTIKALNVTKQPREHGRGVRNGNHEYIYLYSDREHPGLDLLGYLARLGRLMSLAVDDKDQPRKNAALVPDEEPHTT